MGSHEPDALAAAPITVASILDWRNRQLANGHKPKGVLIQCAYCGKDKRISPSAVRGFNVCNNECRAAYLRIKYSGAGHPQYKGNLVTRKCDECGTTRTEFDYRICGAHFFCGKICSNRWNGRAHTGENNSRWKGGRKEEKKRRRSIPRNLVNHRASALVRQTLKRYTGSSDKKNRSWQALLGYGPDELLGRLLETMPDGYSWKDFESGDLHIDHIHPVSMFNFSSCDDPEFKRCWALDNLQLLSAFDNLQKWNRTDWKRPD